MTTTPTIDLTKDYEPVDKSLVRAVWTCRFGGGGTETTQPNQGELKNTKCN